ncbi:MAG TPA: VOC family protein [Streptosporangiaceae bacterium]|jgi:catechol 2,3-dioxygenase-like lactoylglutathione lyase family enzyme
MLDHVGVQVSDVEASVAFYTTVFAAIGVHETLRFDTEDGLVVGLAGPDGIAKFWLSPAGNSETRELHVAFTAADRGQVDAVHDAAAKAGVEVLHEPKEWPMYHPGYYGVFLRDLDGHNVETVSHGG